MKKIVLASLLSVGVMSANNQPLKCVLLIVIPFCKT